MNKLAILCIGVGIASLVLAANLTPNVKASGATQSDVLMRILGGTAEIAAERAYREADVYFHGGVLVECSDREHHYKHRHTEQHMEINPQSHLPFATLLSNLHGDLAPKYHRHLEGAEEREILPWFIIAVKLNPHHIDAWRDGAYWFYRTGESRRAEQFIDEAIQHNPREYRLYLDRGILYFRMKEYAKAVTWLEQAERLWQNNSAESDADLHAIRSYLTYCRRHL